MAKKKALSRARISRRSQERQLERHGVGELAYVKKMTPAEASKIYPGMKFGKRGKVYVLCDADGEVITIADNKEFVLQQAREDDLSVIQTN